MQIFQIQFMLSLQLIKRLDATDGIDLEYGKEKRVWRAEVRSSTLGQFAAVMSPTKPLPVQNSILASSNMNSRLFIQEGF